MIKERTRRRMKSRVFPVPPFELAVRYLPLVEAAVVRLSRQVPAPVGWNTLIAIGALALQDAANRHRSDGSVRFTTHAKRCIRGAILDSLRKQVPASRRSRLQQSRNASQKPAWISGSVLSENQPGAEFAGTLVQLRKLLLDPRCIHEAS